MDNALTVSFELEKDTPGTRRFKEILGPETDDEGKPVLDSNGNPVLRTRGIVGTMYIMKTDLTKAFKRLPKKVQVYIVPVDD